MLEPEEAMAIAVGISGRWRQMERGCYLLRDYVDKCTGRQLDPIELDIAIDAVLAAWCRLHKNDLNTAM